MSNALSTVQQMSETRDYLYQKTKVHVEFIGEDSAIETLASTQRKGTHYTGIGGGSALSSSYIDSSRTEKIQADRTKWIVDYSIYTPKGGGGGGGGEGGQYYTSTDSMTMVQYQFPLYKYLDQDEAAAVASWENLSDEDTEHKKNFEYRKENGSYEALSAVSEKAEKVAKKMFAGIEYVQKSYPQITHVEKFANRLTMTLRQDRLNHIDNTTDVPDLIDDYSWLKTQYDWQENDDSTWTLTEAWIGVPDSDPWDTDLYGLSAWSFFNPADNNNNVRP